MRRSTIVKEEDIAKEFARHSFLQKGVIYDEAKMLNAFSVLTSVKGTFLHAIYQDKYVVAEQLMYMILCVGSRFLPIFQESILNKASIIATLTTFALSLYLSMCVSRWWRLRTDGVGNMWAANNNLPMRLKLMYKRYVRENPAKYKTRLEILSVFRNIQRYLQASLSLTFQTYGQTGFSFIELASRNILTLQELQQLSAQQGTRSESVWAWIVDEIDKLDVLGITTEWCWNEMMQIIYIGRGASGLVAAQMGCHLPFTYFHLVAFIVKINNIIQSLAVGKESQGIYNEVVTIVLVLLVTMLFNTILIVGQRIQNPFTVCVFIFILVIQIAIRFAMS